MAVTCCRCGCQVDADRAEFLMQSKRPVTCPPCSSERQSLVLMEYGHKTAGCAVVVGSDPEQIRMANRAYRRAR